MHLTEGAKISQQLIKQALADPNFTFGIEAEFFLAGAQTFIREHMTQGQETMDMGGGEFFVKKLGELTWHDVVHFLKPLGVSQSELKHDHEVLRDRLFDTYEEVIGEDSASVTPEDAWNQLGQKHRNHELLAMLRAFPVGRLMGVERAQSDSIQDIVYDGDVNEIRPYGKLNEIPVALSEVGYGEEDFSVTDKAQGQLGHATRDAFYNLVAKDISEKLGVKVVYTTDSNYGYHVSGGHQHWFVTEDGSLLSTEEDHDVIGLELVSPVMQANEGFAMLLRVLELMNEGILGLRVITTDKTGLHVNLGVKGKEIDPVKILVLSGDEHMTQKFGRATSENAASIQAELNRRMRAAAQGKASTVLTPKDLVLAASKVLQSIKTEPKDIERAIEVLNSLKPEGKRHSINFEKLLSGYVEYRGIGNKDYHKRGEDIRNAVLHMLGITHIATDPNAYRQEFLKKLYLMIQRALEHELKPGEYIDVPLAASASMVGRGPRGGYGSPLEQYRETPYDGENLVQYGFDPGSNTQ